MDRHRIGLVACFESRDAHHHRRASARLWLAAIPVAAARAASALSAITAADAACLVAAAADFTVAVALAIGLADTGTTLSTGGRAAAPTAAELAAPPVVAHAPVVAVVAVARATINVDISAIVATSGIVATAVHSANTAAAAVGATVIGTAAFRAICTAIRLATAAAAAKEGDLDDQPTRGRTSSRREVRQIGCGSLAAAVWCPRRSRIFAAAGAQMLLDGSRLLDGPRGHNHSLQQGFVSCRAGPLGRQILLRGLLVVTRGTAGHRHAGRARDRRVRARAPRRAPKRSLAGDVRRPLALLALLLGWPPSCTQ